MLHAGLIFSSAATMLPHVRKRGSRTPESVQSGLTREAFYYDIKKGDN